MEQQAKGVERRQCDVLVIGGGPAGSTVAPMLAEKGYKVVVLEKAHHPRFHIGESLLPANLPLFERMGIAEQVKAIGMMKPGAEFVSPTHEMTSVFNFAEAWDKSMPYAYQVKRDQFDEILIRNAQKKALKCTKAARPRRLIFSRTTLLLFVRSMMMDAKPSGRPVLWLMPPVATLSWPIVSRSSTEIPNTTVRLSTDISRVFNVMKVRPKATSRFSGSIMAGSGSYRCPMTLPA
jgi:hypothetical protein